MDNSGSYDDIIAIVNEDAGILESNLVFHHPSTMTQLIKENGGINEGFGPFAEGSVSAGCNVTQCTEAYSKFNEVLQQFGFSFHGKFERDGSFPDGKRKWKIDESFNPDTIRTVVVPVNIPLGLER